MLNPASFLLQNLTLGRGVLFMSMHILAENQQRVSTDCFLQIPYTFYNGHAMRLLFGTRRGDGIWAVSGLHLQAIFSEH